jgi:hypothetical protein
VCIGTRGGEETSVWIFGYEGLKEIYRLEDLGIDERIILILNERMICELEEEMRNKL